MPDFLLKGLNRLTNPLKILGIIDQYYPFTDEIKALLIL